MRIHGNKGKPIANIYIGPDDAEKPTDKGMVLIGKIRMEYGDSSSDLIVDRIDKMARMSRIPEVVALMALPCCQFMIAWAGCPETASITHIGENG